MLASALAVELMVTLLHHPRIDAPADLAAAAAGGGAAAAEASLLGTPAPDPRDALFFRNDVMHGRAFDRCTACSATVVREYEARGFEFLSRPQPRHVPRGPDGAHSDARRPRRR